MKFTEKCPKCGGEVQTKNLKKSIGLGFVDIPVAQFCLNPQCDWYQDFSEAKKPDDIKEDVIQIKIPSIKNKTPQMEKPETHVATPKLPSRKEGPKTILALGGVVVFIVILFYYLTPVFMHPVDTVNNDKAPAAEAPVVNTTQVSAATLTPAPVFAPVESKSYPVKMDVGHGINPGAININRSDTIVWNNEENQRSRIYLVSKDGLFEEHLMNYMDRFSYRFNQSGSYTFVLAEYSSHNEYPNTTGKVIVK